MRKRSKVGMSDRNSIVMGFRVQGLGLRAWGGDVSDRNSIVMGFRVQGLGLIGVGMCLTGTA
jgi:hypothetical protein